MSKAQKQSVAVQHSPAVEEGSRSGGDRGEPEPRELAALSKAH